MPGGFIYLRYDHAKFIVDLGEKIKKKQFNLDFACKYQMSKIVSFVDKEDVFIEDINCDNKGDLKLFLSNGIIAKNGPYDSFDFSYNGYQSHYYSRVKDEAEELIFDDDKRCFIFRGKTYDINRRGTLIIDYEDAIICLGTLKLNVKPDKITLYIDGYEKVFHGRDKDKINEKLHKIMFQTES